jgi:glycosyltransferase involved in cell wall biosynthesis
MKVVIFSKIPVFPSHAGNRSRILKFCEELRASGAEIDYFLFPSRQMNSYDQIAHETFFGPGKFTVLRRSKVQEILFLLKNVFHIVLGRLWPRKTDKIENVDYLWQACFEPEITSVFKSRQYDICLVEYVHFSKLFEFVPRNIFKVLDTHDSFANEFSPAAETKGFLRADKVIAIQDAEADSFKTQLGSNADRVCVISHFVNVTESIDLSSSRGAAFLGSRFEANIISVRYFIEEVLPKILRTAPDFKLYVAGDVGLEIESHPSVIKLGRVARVADAFSQGPILVNPIRAGTGAKIKLLEAMGLGIPSVSTRNGVRGIGAEFLEGVRIVEDHDAEGFAREVVQLVNDRSLRNALGKQAHEAALRWNEVQREHIQALLAEADLVNSAGAARDRSEVPLETACTSRPPRSNGILKSR